MRRRRGAVVRAVAVALALVADACGGGGAKGGGAGVGGGAGRAAGSAGGGAPGAGGARADHYDAGASRGVSFRVALGDAAASKLLTLQVNLAGSQWDYTKDVTVGGTTWQTVTVLWTDLRAAPGAPAFSAAAL